MSANNTSRMFSAKVKLPLAICLALAAGVIAFGTHRMLRNAAVATRTTAAVDEKPQEPAEALLITVHPEGFDPGEIRTAKGKFLLVIDNRSGSPDLDLRLDREIGDRLHEVHIPKELSSWSDLFNLNPGQYVLSDAAHPEWTCRLVVTPQ